MGDRYGLDKIGSMQFKTIEMLEFVCTMFRI